LELYGELGKKKSKKNIVGGGGVFIKKWIPFRRYPLLRTQLNEPLYRARDQENTQKQLKSVDCHEHKFRQSEN
jgi:hypothetical protein